MNGVIENLISNIKSNQTVEFNKSYIKELGKPTTRGTVALLKLSKLANQLNSTIAFNLQS